MAKLDIEVDDEYTQEINDYIRYFGIGEYMYNLGYDIYCDSASELGGRRVDVIAVKKVYVKRIGATAAIQTINGRMSLNKKSNKLMLIEKELKKINKNIPFTLIDRQATFENDPKSGIILKDTINVSIRVPENTNTLPTYLLCQIFGFDPIKRKPMINGQ